jgi:nucleotide-binding universal stress UspA family protein
MRDIARILVPTDFGECSRAALERAASLAEKLGATIDVVHVLELPHYLEGQVMVPTTTGKSEPLDEILLRHAGQEMERFLAGGPRGVRARLESGRPVERIVEVAAKGAFDLIVMGTHGVRRGVLTGSVTERVVRRAPCPVLAVREPARGAPDGAS